MILYHDSFVVVDHPDLAHSRGNGDFGKGFYVTPSMNRQQNGVVDLNVVVRMLLCHNIHLMKVHIKI